MRKALLLLFGMVIISGCVSYEQITTLKTDKSGKMYIHYWLRWEGAQDTILFKRTGLFSEDSLSSELNRGYNKINYVDVYKNYIDSTIHTHIEFNFSNIDSLNSQRAFRDYDFHVKEGPGGTVNFSQMIPSYSTGFGLINDSVTIKYTYYLPGKIINHNASAQELNKLVWELHPSDISQGKVLTATYIPFKLKETPRWIYYFAMIVIVVVITFLFRKK